MLLHKQHLPSVPFLLCPNPNLPSLQEVRTAVLRESFVWFPHSPPILGFTSHLDEFCCYLTGTVFQHLPNALRLLVSSATQCHSTCNGLWISGSFLVYLSYFWNSLGYMNSTVAENARGLLICLFSIFLLSRYVYKDYIFATFKTKEWPCIITNTNFAEPETAGRDFSKVSLQPSVAGKDLTFFISSLPSRTLLLGNSTLEFTLDYMQPLWCAGC